MVILLKYPPIFILFVFVPWLILVISFLQICEQCPDGRFLLVGNSQTLSIITFAMAARSYGILFHEFFNWKNRGGLV